MYQEDFGEYDRLVKSLVRRHMKRCYIFFGYEDYMQEAYLACLRYADRVKDFGQTHKEAYLTDAIKGALHRLDGRNGGVQRIPIAYSLYELDDEDGGYNDRSSVEDKKLEEEIEKREKYKELFEFVERTKRKPKIRKKTIENFRKIVELTLENRTPTEISQILGTSLNNVNFRLRQFIAFAKGEVEAETGWREESEEKKAEREAKEKERKKLASVMKKRRYASDWHFRNKDRLRIEKRR